MPEYSIIELGPKRYALGKKQIGGWWRVVASGTEHDIKVLKEELSERARQPDAAPVVAKASRATGASRGDKPRAYAPGYEWGLVGVATVYRKLGAEDWFYLDGHNRVRDGSRVTPIPSGRAAG